MADKVLQQSQIKLEVTPGTNVACTTRLLALSIMPVREGGANVAFAPEGFRANTLTKATNREHGTVTVNGIADYRSLAWVLDSVYGKATPVQLGGSAAYSRTYEFKPNDEPVRSTFSAEFGDEDLASEVSYMVFHSFGLVINREDITLNLGAFSGKIVDGITLASVTNTVAPIPMLAQQVKFYLEDTLAELDDDDPAPTALDRAVEIDYHCNNGVKPRYSANADGSFSEVTELLPEHGGSLKLWKNADAMDIRADARANKRQWLRILIEGAVIASTYKYTLKITCPIEFLDPGAQGDEDDAVAITLPFTCVYDKDEEYAAELVLINNVVAVA